jgi:aryl-alcohol dehydrogenase-like predicted oxidoreductase
VQLHGPTDEVLRRGEVTAALKRARDRGLTRFIGYSGDGEGAMIAVKSGDFDTLQISVSIADQEAIDGAIAEAALRGMGVIAKRPIANAVWVKPAGSWLDSYFRPYRDRLKRLDYDFLKASARESVAMALRFTLSVPGVHTAIVGTTRPGRWQHNADAIAAGPLPKSDYEMIRERWRTVAKPNWVGQR